MINYQQHKQITDAQLRPLYQSVGWLAYTNLPDLSVLIKGSKQVISAWDKDTLVGLVRSVGDGVYIELIQDLLVLPDYQGKGIGYYLLNQLLEQTQDKQQVFLITDKGQGNTSTLAFYQKIEKLVPFEQMNITGFYRYK